MPRKGYRPEDIIAKLREADVLLGQGKKVSEVVKALGVSEVKLRDELLDGEIFYSLREAEVVIESWRRHYNQVRPHASLGYRAPAPEVFVPVLAARAAPPVTLPLAPRPALH